jgi:hypothetical protein
MCGRYASSILERQDWAIWPGEAASDHAVLLSCSRSAAAGVAGRSACPRHAVVQFRHLGVRRVVIGSPRNNEPELLESIAA